MVGKRLLKLWQWRGRRKGDIVGSGLMLPGEIGQVMVAREGSTRIAYPTGGAAATLAAA